ncbi:MAG: inorganic phosphate transporter [Thermosphaera sp.]
MIGTDVIGVFMAGVFALMLAWIDGANNAGNSIGTLIGAKALSLKKALLIAGLAELLGGVLYGGFVSETILKRILNPTVFSPSVYGVGLTGSMLITFLLILSVTMRKIPFSITQILIGSLVGFGIGYTRGGAVNFPLVSTLLVLWMLLPMIGMLVGAVSFKLYELVVNSKRAWTVYFLVFFYYNLFIISSVLLLLPSHFSFFSRAVIFVLTLSVLNVVPVLAMYKTVKNRRARTLDSGRIFPSEALAISSGMMAFTHGAHDVANAAGPLAGAIAAFSTNTLSEEGLSVSPFLLLLCSGGISAGVLTWGLRVARTIGENITVLNNDSAFMANFSASITMLFITRMGLPTSMTGLVIGSIAGVGLARGVGSVNLKLIARIFSYWYIGFTIALFSGIFMGLMLTIL